MKVRQLVGSAIKIGVLAVCVYVAMNWKSISGSGDGVEGFAKSACLDATNSRFDVTKTRVYDLAANANGYVVRLSVTLANGEPARVLCLTTPHGGVRDITIDVR